MSEKLGWISVDDELPDATQINQGSYTTSEDVAVVVERAPGWQVGRLMSFTEVGMDDTWQIEGFSGSWKVLYWFKVPPIPPGVK